MSLKLLDQFNEITIQQIKIKLCHYYPEYWTDEVSNIYQIDIPVQLNNAVPKRLTEFVAGRVLAKQLLAEYNCYQSVDILQDRSPAWPNGFIGSITHAKGIAASVVLPVNKREGVGLDLEYWLTAELATEIQLNICILDELNNFSVDFSFNEKMTLIFSAKETLYKMLYPRVKQFFDFTDAKLISQTGDYTAGTLQLILLKSLGRSYVQGTSYIIHYRNDKESCLTLAAI